MSDLFTFGAPAKPQPPKYARLGFSRNPFDRQDEDEANAPFFGDHLSRVMSQIQEWLTDAAAGNPPALSVKGTIGVGKTRLLKAILQSVRVKAESERVHAAYVTLQRAGFAKPSVGGLVLGVLESCHPDWVEGLPNRPDGVMPLIWASAFNPIQVSDVTLIGNAINCLKSARVDTKPEIALLICRWLRREPLSKTQSERVGLFKRLEYEGEMPDALAELLAALAEDQTLRKLFLLVDQMEDLFLPGYSELRQSRLLTDLRGLIDKADSGAPLALVLSWSPDVDELGSGARELVEREMQRSYVALYNRLERRLVTIDKLREVFAEGFAQKYMDALVDVDGNDKSKWPSAANLKNEAWTKLERRGRVSDQSVTARDLLNALREAVEERADAA